MPLPYVPWSHVEVEVWIAVGSVYFVAFVVHFGSVSGSRALFVGRFRIAMELFTPDSARSKALDRELV